MIFNAVVGKTGWTKVKYGDDDDEEKTAEKHLYEKPEKRDVMTDINPNGK